MPTELPFRKTLSDEHVTAIGHVITQWAGIETFLRHILCELAAGKPIPTYEGQDSEFILTSGMDSRTSLGIVRALACRQFPNDTEEIEKLTDRIAKEASRRHGVAHGLWRKGKRPGTIETETVKSVGHIKIEHHAYTVSELMALAHRIAACGRDTLQFFRKRGYLRPPFG